MIYIFSIILFQLTFWVSETYTHKAWTFDNNGQELLLCRKCGTDVADSYYIFSKPSPGSQKTEKQNLFGRQNVTIQTLVNPFGIKFEIITMEKVRCKNVGTEQGAHSWFPGYTWRICLCPNCGQHLGWIFEKSEDIQQSLDHEKGTFYGLILSRILGENFTDSLITLPKIYGI